MVRISKYVHHGFTVSVINKIKGKHKEHCLCWQNCYYFQPNMSYNCRIAKALYEVCVLENVTTPVYECARYSKAKEPPIHKPCPVCGKDYCICHYVHPDTMEP